jgi:hypothetical protein
MTPRIASHNNPKTARPLVIAAGLAALLTSAAPALAQSAAVDEQYRQALYQRETGEPYTAIETLESLLSANPTLNRARMELAVAYYRTLNFARAKAESQRVLDDPQTPENVKLSVLSFLKQLELEEKAAFEKPHKFEPNVALGLLYDSNVNAGPDNALISPGLLLTPGSLKTSDWGVVGQAGLTHTWLSPSPVRLGQSTARFGWVNQASLYYKGYHNEHDYDLGVVTLATGPTLIVGNAWRGNINLQVDHLTFGGDTLGVYTSLSPSASVRVGLNGEITGDVQWVHRDFKRSIDTGRDSNYRSVGLAYGHLFNRGQLAVQAGGRWFDESADADRFSNDGYEYFVGARLRAWNGGDLFARAAWRRARYDGVEPLFNAARRETEHRVELGASHTFQAGWLEKWQLSGTVTNVHNEANLSLYGYDRDTVQITLGRGF